MVEIDREEKLMEIGTYIDNDPAFLPAAQSGGFWVGATDEAEEGSWLWVTSGRSLSSWAVSWFGLSSLSALSDTEDCTVLIEQIGAATKKTWECGSLKPVVCEIGENSLTCKFVN